MVAASFRSQTISESPGMLTSVVVDGVTYLIADADASDDPIIIKVNGDGSFTSYPLVDFPSSKSAAVAGSKIIMTGTTATSTEILIMSFDTTTNICSSVTISNAAGYSYGNFVAGALGPDGLVYCPPYVSSAGAFGSSHVLVVDPATGGGSLTNFGGTFVPDYYGAACLGGDGLMYFLPGLNHAIGGPLFDGDTVGWLDFATMTFDSDSVVNQSTVWALPAPDGVYVGTGASEIVKYNTSGGTLILDRPSDQHYLSSAAVGVDGRIYTVGWQDYPIAYRPALAWVDPADDSAGSFELPGAALDQFSPCVTFALGDTIQAFQLGSGYPDVFVASFNDALWSFAVGAIPVSLALGANPVTGTVG